MNVDDKGTPARVRWARLRLSVVGPLLYSPPGSGELFSRLKALSEMKWTHPTTGGETIQFSKKTIERWFYAVRNVENPICHLERKTPKHAGSHPSISDVVAKEITQLRRAHPRWSYQLVHDNLVASAEEKPELGNLPSYATVRRFMTQHGLTKQRRLRRHEQAPDFVRREQRSFEVTHTHALWHFDFHHGKRNVLVASGEWKRPVLLGIVDDHSRLCCHIQWYLDETAETLIHGLCQAFQKRGLPRAVLSDNGAPMVAAETKEGLERLSITHFTTLPQTPEQNGKQERFWGQVEGRLMAMLEGEQNLTLELLNRATLAYAEEEYHRKVHDETGMPPLDRALKEPSRARACPPSEMLRRSFRTEVTRRQRISDGTITVEGIRYEVPSAYRTLRLLSVRVARFDLSNIDLVDARSGIHLATLFPVDKHGNANRRRREIPKDEQQNPGESPTTGIAPLLQKLMRDYAATGLPPAYIPLDTSTRDDDESAS